MDKLTIKLNTRVKMTFKRIEACQAGFWMGSRGYASSEEPIHRVTIPEDYWMAETPVTQAQFAVWTRHKRIKHQNESKGKPDHPAENMSWHQASDYCEWLTQRYADQLPSDFPLATLPSEAHWEYACRAGSTTEYHTGDGEVALAEAGWYSGNRREAATHPVGQLRPNEFGLYDMHGNVWEWCRDRWDAGAYRRRWAGITAEKTFALNDRFGAEKIRVVRGGSWIYSAFWCRTAFRIGFRADDSNWNFGFRVCLVRSPTVKEEQ